MKVKKQNKETGTINSTSPINTKKINALSQAYENLPSNGFSKLVVTLCLFCGIVTLIASFVFLYMGYDASALNNAALVFFGSELLILGAKTIFTKEQTKDEIIFEQIKHDLNDGIEYDAEGNPVKTIINNTYNNTYNTTTEDTVINSSHEDIDYNVDDDKDESDEDKDYKLEMPEGSISFPEKKDNEDIKQENSEFGEADEDGRG